MRRTRLQPFQKGHKECPPGDSTRDLFIPKRWRSLSSHLKNLKGSRFHSPSQKGLLAARFSPRQGVFMCFFSHICPTIHSALVSRPLLSVVACCFAFSFLPPGSTTGPGEAEPIRGDWRFFLFFQEKNGIIVIRRNSVEIIGYMHHKGDIYIYIWFRVPCCHPPPHGMVPPLPPYLIHFAHATVAKRTFPYFCMHAAVAKRTFSFCWMNPPAGFGGSIARNCGEMQILSSRNCSAQCTGHFNAQQMESYTYTYPCTYTFININNYICNQRKFG